MVKKLSIAAAVLALAVAAAGCGGGNDTTTTTAEATPAGEWADGFCTAVTTWESALKDIASQFTDLSSFSQEGLQNAADDAKSATDQLVADLKALGTPDTQSGEEVKSSVDTFSTTIQSQLDSIQTTVDETSGIAELPAAAKKITTSVTAMTTAFSDTWSTIQNADVGGELKDALDSSSACTDLRS